MLDNEYARDLNKELYEIYEYSRIIKAENNLILIIGNLIFL